MNSRERMLTAISGGRPDRVPLSFMIFNALRARTAGWRDYVDTGTAMGLDMVVDLGANGPAGSADTSDLPGPPIHFAPGVTIRERREVVPGRQYPLLHKEYVTPAGTLSCTVNQTDDWPYGDHVGFFNDYIEPRAERFPINSPGDLEALKYLLVEPTAGDIRRCREAWREPKQFAADRGLLLSAGWGVAGDALAWLFGLTRAIYTAVDEPDFLTAILDVIGAWNRRRMEIALEAGVDMYIRRGWYEGTSFWSPDLYRRFLLPGLKREAALAHQAGAKFGYIMTVGSLQFVEMLIEAGVDVVIGVEDVQDHGMDYRKLKAAAAGKMGLWGGVNGFVTIEEGGDAGIVAATKKALAQLGPDGFILSPVDNIRVYSNEVWRKTMLFVETWRKLTANN
ncbi:MAG: uroporphyrinogen decarboxylase family protein [Phycisphaerae bacterium]